MEVGWLAARGFELRRPCVLVTVLSLDVHQALVMVVGRRSRRWCLFSWSDMVLDFTRTRQGVRHGVKAQSVRSGEMHG